MASDFSAISATTAPNKSATGSLTKNTAMGKDEFLTLLVTQLKNQDPLNPDKGTEFTAQLAQFSSLEQLMNINTQMANITASSKNSDNIALLNTIGKDVTYYGNSFDYSGENIEFGYMLPENASSVKVELKLDGQTVHTVEDGGISKGSHTFTWDGLTKDGKPAAQGKYEVVVTAQGSENAIVAPAILKSKVTGVNLDPLLGASLTTTIGTIDSYANILGIQEPKAPATPPAPVPEDDETNNNTAS